jgi:hypothetical protein
MQGHSVGEGELHGDRAEDGHAHRPARLALGDPSPRRQDELLLGVAKEVDLRIEELLESSEAGMEVVPGPFLSTGFSTQASGGFGTLGPVFVFGIVDTPAHGTIVAGLTARGWAMRFAVGRPGPGLCTASGPVDVCSVSRPTWPGRLAGTAPRGRRPRRVRRRRFPRLTDSGIRHRAGRFGQAATEAPFEAVHPRGAGQDDGELVAAEAPDDVRFPAGGPEPTSLPSTSMSVSCPVDPKPGRTQPSTFTSTSAGATVISAGDREAFWGEFSR